MNMYDRSEIAKSNKSMTIPSKKEIPKEKTISKNISEKIHETENNVQKEELEPIQGQNYDSSIKSDKKSSNDKSIEQFESIISNTDSKFNKKKDAEIVSELQNIVSSKKSHENISDDKIFSEINRMDLDVSVGNKS